MDKRFSTFLTLSALILAINVGLTMWMAPPPKPQKPGPAPAAKDKNQIAAAPAGPAKEGAAPAPAPQPGKPPAAGPNVAVRQPDAAVGRSLVSLGSLDPASPYRMLVILTNEGGAILRAELNNPRFRDLEDRSGYLGHLEPEAADGGGCRVRVVGRGTPAAAAGLKVGDVIRSINGNVTDSPAQLARRLRDTKPKDTIRLAVRRGGKPVTLTAKLIRRPLEILRPELNTLPLDTVGRKHDPFSMLLTLARLDNRTLEDQTLKGIDLATMDWRVEAADQSQVTFAAVVPGESVEILKHYRLAKAEAKQLDDRDAPVYHLEFSVELRNAGDQERRVAYQLNGPTGLALEGRWYASKISHTWSAAGLRDVVMQFEGNPIAQNTPPQIAEGKVEIHTDPPPLNFVAVDGQYFAAALLPLNKDRKQSWFSEVTPTLAGPKPENSPDYRLANTSFRLKSIDHTLKAGETFKHDYQLFLGPKRPDLLAQYGTLRAPLSGLVTYGWFGWVATPMLNLLHFFHDHMVHHYALAIILLTVLVRGCMFPLSRKQALSAQKMQELQPELKRLTEKYKTNLEQKTKAQQELFRKHNYNPLGGCLLMFIQLPVFIGLYRSLMVDVELRQAPLITESIRWGSDLAAPDMLWDWSAFMPDFIAGTHGWLGPYLNILPLITIALFIWQQKMFMPPPADEQAALQQKMMQYMMIFMGVMFFKVASGLCLYFIASSIWGIAERKLLPKTTPPGSQTPAKATATAGGNGSPPGGRKKQRERR